MEKIILTFLLSSLISAAVTSPYYRQEDLEPTYNTEESDNHTRVKRFVAPWSRSENVAENGLISKMRTKRSFDEECEKLQLCNLHSRSRNNFFAAFQLYFVNKENARLWDHHVHTKEDCESKYRSQCVSLESQTREKRLYEQRDEDLY